MTQQKYPKFIVNSAEKSVLFQDFLSFLQLLRERSLELTQTGNLRLKEIDAVHDVCQHDFFPRDKNGELLFSIRSEDDLVYLQHLRQLAYANRFTSKRKRKLRLSKDGREFLQLSIEKQFLLVIEAQLFSCNWQYLFPFGGRREEVLEIIQDQAISFLKLLLENAADKWYELTQMTEDLAQKLDIEPAIREGYSGDEDLLTNALVWLAKVIFKNFDLVSLKTKKEKKLSYTFTEIEKIKLTSIGKYALELFAGLAHSEQINKFPDNVSPDEVDRQLHHIIKLLKLEDQITPYDIKNIIYHSPKSSSSTNIFSKLTPYIEDFDQMQSVASTLQTAWNHSPHRCLNNLTPHQKMMEVYMGKKVKASKPNYNSTKTRAHQLFPDSLPKQLRIHSWGDGAWGVDLNHGYYQAESDLEKIRDQGDIKQTKILLEKLLKKEPLFLPAVSDLNYIYRELGQDKKANLLMEKAHKQFLELFPSEFTPGEDTFPWTITNNRPFLNFLFDYAVYIKNKQGVNKTIPYLEQIIELNPNDNQGIRGILATAYLTTNQPSKVLQLSEKFSDDILPELAMGKILALYKLDRKDEAKEFFEENSEFLEHLRSELLADTHQPPPDSDSPFGGVLVGGPEEAWLFWESQHAAWDGTKGVLDWLKNIVT